MDISTDLSSIGYQRPLLSVDSYALLHPAYHSLRGDTHTVHTMAKCNTKRGNPAHFSQATLSDLQENTDLWYRIHVLLYDLSNLGSNILSEKRTSSTTNELYISAPYFTDSEAARIRTTLVDDDLTSEQTTVRTELSAKIAAAPRAAIFIESAIHRRMADFFDKRRASGDARPCGPHDMIPIYRCVFKIEREELKDKKFLSRLRRSGLGDFATRDVDEAGDAGEGTEKVSNRKKNR